MKIEKPAVVKAALIDMDGVLYDTMPFHARAWKELFDEIGIFTTYEEFFLYEGMTGFDTINLIFKRELNRELTREEADEIYKRKTEIFNSFNRRDLMPGAKEMLEKLKKHRVKCILVTGSGQRSILDAIERDYPGIFSAENRVTASDVKRGKPDPEPYLLGLKKSGLEANEVIVIENAPLGVRAGIGAGVYTVALMTGPIEKGAFVKEGASVIFESVEKFADSLENYFNFAE